MPKESKAVKDFVDEISDNLKEETNRYYHRGYKLENIISYLSGLSVRKLGLLVSDKYWNKYPTWTESRVVDRRSHYRCIELISSHIKDFYPEMDSVLKKKAQGAFALCYLDIHGGKDRVYAANRLFESKDIRVRKRVARILPISKAKKMLNDTACGVRNILIGRVGIDNCAEQIYEWKDWYSMGAVEAMDLSDDEALAIITSLDDDSSLYGSYKERIALILLKKLSTETLLYHLNLADTKCFPARTRAAEYVSKVLMVESSKED